MVQQLELGAFTVGPRLYSWVQSLARELRITRHVVWQKKKKKKINDFGKVSGHKINAQNYLIFLYTNSKRSEREIKETTPLLFHQKNKIPRNKPT